jgi:hypothetical protein
MSLAFLVFFSKNIFAEQAKNCEFYVSAVASEYTYHGMANQVFHLKVNESLKNDISKVGFYAKLDEWQEYAAEYNERTQTYVAKIGVGPANLYLYTNKIYEGVFFMETKNGTRYWLNNGGVNGVNFYIDENFLRVVSETNFQWRLYEGALLTTTNPSPFSSLNPFSCR